jgi:putative FmdB family regulatory protein
VPLYEYVCRACARPFEALVFGQTKPDCPACGSADLERQLSVVSVGRSDGAAAGPAPCGSCGDPRGPGACARN